MEKKIISTLLASLLTTAVCANDTYVLSYSKDTNCTLTKNAKSIPLFDPKFDKETPHSSYTCSAIQKEQYNDCKRLETKNTTAEFLGFGAYEYTNLIIAFQNPHKSVKSSLTLECTKNLPKKSK